MTEDSIDVEISTTIFKIKMTKMKLMGTKDFTFFSTVLQDQYTREWDWRQRRIRNMTKVLSAKELIACNKRLDKKILDTIVKLKKLKLKQLELTYPTLSENELGKISWALSVSNNPPTSIKPLACIKQPTSKKTPKKLLKEQLKEKPPTPKKSPIPKKLQTSKKLPISKKPPTSKKPQMSTKPQTFKKPQLPNKPPTSKKSSTSKKPPTSKKSTISKKPPTCKKPPSKSKKEKSTTPTKDKS